MESCWLTKNQFSHDEAMSWIKSFGTEIGNIATYMSMCTNFQKQCKKTGVLKIDVLKQGRIESGCAKPDCVLSDLQPLRLLLWPLTTCLISSLLSVGVELPLMLLYASYMSVPGRGDLLFLLSSPKDKYISVLWTKITLLLSINSCSHAIPLGNWLVIN